MRRWSLWEADLGGAGARQRVIKTGSVFPFEIVDVFHFKKTKDGLEDEVGSASRKDRAILAGSGSAAPTCLGVIILCRVGPTGVR